MKLNIDGSDEKPHVIATAILAMKALREQWVGDIHKMSRAVTHTLKCQDLAKSCVNKAVLIKFIITSCSLSEESRRSCSDHIAQRFVEGWPKALSPL